MPYSKALVHYTHKTSLGTLNQTSTGANSSHGGGSRDVLVEENVAGFPSLLSSLIPSHHLAQALMASSMLDIILIFQLGNLLTLLFSIRALKPSQASRVSYQISLCPLIPN